MESLDHEVMDVIGPALPPKTQQSELLNECHVDYELVNGIPCYQQNHVIEGHVQIFERIGFDDRVGGTFLGLAADGKELVIRVGPADTETHIVRMEASFLCRVETELNDWRYFSQVHKIFTTDDAYHLSLYFRGGPTLEQCFGMRKTFSFGTAGRLSNDVLNIIYCAHKHGYFLRNVNMDCFHYDAASRHLFQADISSLVKNMTLSENGGHVAAYAGHLDYAPLAHHFNENVGPRHDLESWFYQLLHMILGELPWGALASDKIAEVKKGLRESTEFLELPQQFHKIAEIAFSDNLISISPEEYAVLIELTNEIYTKLGGISDYEENMDFEREPTPDEVPRLVLCRDDEVGEPGASLQNEVASTLTPASASE